MRGIIAGKDSVIAHLLRASEQIREDAQSVLGDLTAEQIWAKPNGMTSAGFHAKHLAGSTNRLVTYLEGNQLMPDQLAAIHEEGAGDEPAVQLTSLIDAALDRYDEIIRNLKPEDFAAIRDVGRKRYQVTAVSIAIHIAEHAQRHIGGMIAAAKMARPHN
jgi:hypothetical protein